jgi:hypothetical protein
MTDVKVAANGRKRLVPRGYSGISLFGGSRTWGGAQ